MLPTPYHSLRRISSASAELITLAEAKLYLRVDHTQDDLLISEMIVAVRCYAEQFTGRSLVEQSWEVSYLQSLPCNVMLPMRPIQSVIAVQLRDASGAVQTIPSARYRLFSSSLLHSDVVLSADIITIAYLAGDSTNFPRDLRQAMLIHLGMCYDIRGAEAPLPAAALQIYETYREIRI